MQPQPNQPYPGHRPPQQGYAGPPGPPRPGSAGPGYPQMMQPGVGVPQMSQPGAAPQMMQPRPPPGSTGSFGAPPPMMQAPPGSVPAMGPPRPVMGPPPGGVRPPAMGAPLPMGAPPPMGGPPPAGGAPMARGPPPPGGAAPGGFMGAPPPPMTAPPRGMAPPPPGQAPPPPATGAPPMSGMPPPGQAMAGGPPRFTPPGSGGPPPPPFGATSTPGAGHMPPPQTAPSGPRPPAMGAPPAAGQVSKPFSPSPPAPFVGGGSPSATPGVPTYSPPTIGGSHTGGHIPNAFAAGGPPSMAPPTPGPGAPMFAPPHGVGAPPISQMGPPPPKFGAPSATMQPSMAGGRPMSAMPAGAGSQAAVGALADSFQALMMEGGGQGGAGGMVDPNQFPRPLGGHPQGPPATAGSCSSRFIRFSTNALPNSAALANRWKLPLGASIHALAPGNPENDKDVPVVNFGQSGIVRCRKCRTYINPYAAFTEGGRRWRCNVCSLLNEVPVDYFCTLDAEGRRRDVLERPELCCGSVEFVAPAEYMVRPPMPPVYVFVVDVSFAAYSTGCVGPIIETIKQCLDELPGDERTQIGFLTYDTTLHFYNLKSTLSQPQMLVVTDLEDPFLPLPDELLANLRESRHVVDALLDSLAGIASQAQASETAVGPALQAAQLIMSHIGGKLLLFTSMLPSLGAGTLKQRKDEARLYGTDREHTLRNPEGDFYKKMAADCSRLQICVDVFAISQRPFIDIASLATLPKYTGGEVRFYPNFNEAADGAKLRAELRNNLVRETGWEAVMRVRCGKGLRVASFRGSFFIRSSDLLALPAVDCDKAITVEFGYDEQLLASTTAYLQCALLYTSSSGERRIRVHTVAVPICNDLGDLYRAADVGAAIACMSRLGVEKAMTGKLEEARSAITSMCGGVLREYRLLYAAQFRGTGSLVLPDALRLLPLYALGLVKSEAFRGGGREVSTDDRSAALAEVTNMSVEQLLDYAYPAMYSLHDMPQQCGTMGEHGELLMPARVPLVAERMDMRGMYLIHNGLTMLLWVGKMASPEMVVSLLGPELAAMRGGVDATMAGAQVPELPNELSHALHRVIARLRAGRPIYMTLRVVRQGEASEVRFMDMLVEDRGVGGSSYADFLCTLHRQVQAKA